MRTFLALGIKGFPESELSFLWENAKDYHQ